MVLEMSFLTLSSTDMSFSERELTGKSYIVIKALPTTKRVKLSNKKEFAKAAFNEQFETFVVHVAARKAPLSGMRIHFSWVTQILNSNPVKIAALKQNKVPIEVLAEYSDFADIFSEKKALVLLEQTDLNKHVIKLESDK